MTTEIYIKASTTEEKIDGKKAKGVGIEAKINGDKLDSPKILALIGWLLDKTELDKEEQLEILTKIGKKTVEDFERFCTDDMIEKEYKSETAVAMFERFKKDERWQKVLGGKSNFDVSSTQNEKLLAFVATALKSVADAEKTREKAAKRLENLFLSEIAEV